MQGICVLGSTGSIGRSTLDVMARHPERYRAIAFSAHRDAERLFQQCCEHSPRYAVLIDEQAAEQFRSLAASRPGFKTELLTGEKALQQIAALDEVDMVMAAIVGAAGLLATLAAARAGKRILLANKEALVMSGQLMLDAVKASGAVLLPIDSEHNAIYQCLPRHDYASNLREMGVEKILLTASGGPFRNRSLDELQHVTPEQACNHPNWSMGRKISVDSATMMNKGLEVIEACWLFNLSPEQVQVVVHPQSIIHSMVSYSDGSVLAQMGNPDMRTPIAYAMAWPERIGSGVEPLDLFQVARLDFQAPDFQRFPALRLAFEAAAASGTATTILNAANEVAVDLFLQQKLPFMQISALVESCLQELPVEPVESIEQLLHVDARVRSHALNLARSLM